MQRRLNIACSVLHRPRILLLDEPTVGVDPQSRERIFGMLETLLEDGTAILLTTHNLEEAQIRCDRIAIIDHGQIVATGTFEELLNETVGTSQQVRIQFSSRQIAVPRALATRLERPRGFLRNRRCACPTASLIVRLGRCQTAGRAHQSA
jgi:ABC-type multidrug transport system ATPase subunit